MNDKVSTAAFLKKIHKRNSLDLDVNVNLLTVGFWAGDSFYTLDFNVRSLNGVGIPYDLSKATGIREESFQKLPDGRYRYSVSLFDNTVIKFIARNENGEVVSETEYSDINYIEMPRISERNKLSYRIRAKKEIPGRNYPFDSIEYKFMHETGE